MVNSIGELIEKTRKELNKLTGLKLSSTVGAIKDEKGWRIIVEMIEKKSIPDQMDILAIYEAIVDDNGNLFGFERKRMRKRIETSEEK
ncbi:MAG: gas vesicle protein GvpO [Acidobacteriota bacterium]